MPRGMSARQPALGFIFVTLFLDVLGIGLVIPILPELVREFQGGNTQAAAQTFGWLAALYSLMQFLFAPVLGSLSDRFGRRPVILGSLFGSGLDYLLLAFAPSLPWFFAGRVIAGITGANITAATAYIADVSPPEKRAQNFGLIGAAFGLGFVAGPALGGWLGHIGLRVPFFAAAALTLLNWAYGAFILPESLPQASRRPFSWSRANPVGSLLALRRYPVVLGLTGTFFLINLAHQVFPATWVLYTKYRFQWTELDTGLSFAAVGVMAAVVQGGLARKIIPRLGERASVLAGLGIATATYLGYGIANQGWMMYAMIIFGSFGGICGPAAQGLISRGVRADEQGAVQGALASLGSVAGIIGPPIAAGLFSRFTGPQALAHLPGAAFFFGGFLTVIAWLLAARSFRTRPRS